MKNIKQKLTTWFDNSDQADQLVERLQDSSIKHFSAGELDVVKKEDGSAVISDPESGEKVEISINEETNSLDVKPITEVQHDSKGKEMYLVISSNDGDEKWKLSKVDMDMAPGVISSDKVHSANEVISILKSEGLKFDEKKIKAKFFDESEVKEEPKTEEVKDEPKTEEVKDEPKTEEVKDKPKTEEVKDKPKTEEVKSKDTEESYRVELSKDGAKITKDDYYVELTKEEIKSLVDSLKSSEFFSAPKFSPDMINWDDKNAVDGELKDLSKNPKLDKDSKKLLERLSVSAYKSQDWDSDKDQIKKQFDSWFKTSGDKYFSALAASEDSTDLEKLAKMGQVESTDDLSDAAEVVNSTDEAIAAQPTVELFDEEAKQVNDKINEEVVIENNDSISQDVPTHMLVKQLNESTDEVIPEDDNSFMYKKLNNQKEEDLGLLEAAKYHKSKNLL